MSYLTPFLLFIFKNITSCKLLSAPISMLQNRAIFVKRVYLRTFSLCKAWLNGVTFIIEGRMVVCSYGRQLFGDLCSQRRIARQATPDTPRTWPAIDGAAGPVQAKPNQAVGWARQGKTKDSIRRGALGELKLPSRAGMWVRPGCHDIWIMHVPSEWADRSGESRRSSRGNRPPIHYRLNRCAMSTENWWKFPRKGKMEGKTMAQIR